MQDTSSYTRFLCFCISVFSAFYISSVARAEETCANSVFFVKGVEVAVQAESGEAARQQATDQGRDQAWDILKNRLLISNQPVDGDGDEFSIDDFIDYTRIDEETVLANRYQGRFDYCFDRLRVRDYFKAKGLNHAELVSAKMLILPIWNEANSPRLWRQPNPWFKAWKDQLETHDGLVRMMLTKSLLAERSIKVSDLLLENKTAIAQIAMMEKVERVVIAVLTPEKYGAAIRLSMTAKLYRKDGSFMSDIYSITDFDTPVSNIPVAVSALTDDMARGVEGVWRRANQINLDDAGVLMVRIPAASIGEWTKQINVLETLPPIDRLEVVQLTASGGVVRLHLAGSMTALTNALEQHQLKIEDQRERKEVPLTLVATSNTTP